MKSLWITIVAVAASAFGVACAGGSNDVSGSGHPDGGVVVDSSVDTTVADTAPEACGEGQTTCGGKCVDTRTDEKNCGSCGKACGVDESCTAGACALNCPTTETACGGLCVRLDTDNSNCGKCGVVCGAGQVCSGGKCALSCAPPFTECTPSSGGDAGPDADAAPVDAGSAPYCANLGDDRTNCGACGTVCPAGYVCTAGKCEISCVSGLTPCGTPPSCRDLSTDNANCGACGTACPTGQVCSAGACKTSCGGGLTDCSGVCRDLSSDINNCGACGAPCIAGETCVSGVCKVVCSTGLTACGATCRDTKVDPSNCGGCGIVCPTGEACVGGTCSLSCSGTLTNCSGTCRDLSVDPANCGTCAHACGPTEICSGGACGCSAGLTDCSGKCVDVKSDPANCGACGAACGGTASCVGGTCGTFSTCPRTTPPKVLFYGPTGNFEQSYLPAGATPTTADAATWGAMTLAQFQSYDMIIIGDVEAGSGGIALSASLWDAANANKATWSAAISGRIVVSAQDPTFHAVFGSGGTGPATFLKAVLQWVAQGTGTGLYVGPQYGDRPNYDFLSAIGSFPTSTAAGDDVHIVLTSHPTMIGSTDATLSNWFSAFHQPLTGFPAGFVAVTQQTSAPGNTIMVAKDVCK